MTNSAAKTSVIKAKNSATIAPNKSEVSLSFSSANSVAKKLQPDMQMGDQARGQVLDGTEQPHCRRVGGLDLTIHKLTSNEASTLPN